MPPKVEQAVELGHVYIDNGSLEPIDQHPDNHKKVTFHSEIDCTVIFQRDRVFGRKTLSLKAGDAKALPMKKMEETSFEVEDPSGNACTPTGNIIVP